MADMDMADVPALGALAAHRLMDRTEGRPPADDRELAALGTQFDDLIGHLDAVDLVLPDVGPRLMIFGGVIAVAGVVFLLDSADAVVMGRELCREGGGAKVGFRVVAGC